MNLQKLALQLALLLSLFTYTALAQAPPAPQPDTTVYRTFHLANGTQINDPNEIVNTIRVLMSPSLHVALTPSLNDLSVRGTPEQLTQIEQILHDLDRPRKPFRLTYAITEIDSGKRIGTQHFAMVVLAGGRTVLKQGSKVPVATGSFAPNSAPSTGTQTQFTYLDIGLNIDASIDEGVDGVRLRTKIEQSGLAQETSGVGPGDPIVRQTILEGTSILAPGKPIIIGSLDIPSTTRHLDIEVVLEPLR